MVVAVLAIAGVLALLFYVMYLVQPKRVRLSARVFRLVEFNVEADGESRGAGKQPGGDVPAEGSSVERPGDGLKVLPGSGQEALP